MGYLQESVKKGKAYKNGRTAIFVLFPKGRIQFWQRKTPASKKEAGSVLLSAKEHSLFGIKPFLCRRVRLSGFRQIL